MCGACRAEAAGRRRRGVPRDAAQPARAALGGGVRGAGPAVGGSIAQFAPSWAERHGAPAGEGPAYAIAGDSGSRSSAACMSASGISGSSSRPDRYAS